MIFKIYVCGGLMVTALTKIQTQGFNSLGLNYSLYQFATSKVSCMVSGGTVFFTLRASTTYTMP